MRIGDAHCYLYTAGGKLNDNYAVETDLRC